MSKNSLGDIWNLKYPAGSLRPAVLPIGISGGETQVYSCIRFSHKITIVGCQPWKHRIECCEPSVGLLCCVCVVFGRFVPRKSRTNGLINVQYEKFANFVHEYRLFIEVKLFPGKRSGPFSFDKPSKAENHKAEHHGPPFSKTRVINVSRYTINSWQAYL